ncbi:MAG TPA: alpha-amylase family glycosyl hydrolase [Xanthobacteraceae bacterium]|nr:alpha-amylase family glycosyl hydrolase [Xanthobacteraceae bacterium]
MKSPISPRGAGRLLALCACLLAPACLAAQSAVHFRTDGGDAWTFDKRIEASVLTGRCDEVVIASDAGTVRARPHRGEITARVRLGPGNNVIAAQCRRDGVSNGPPAHQRWRVRLNDVPTARPSVEATASGLVLAGNDSEPAPVAGAPIVTYAWRGSVENPSRLAGLPAQGARVALPVPRREGEYRVRLRVVDAVGRADEGTVVFRVAHGRVEAIDPLRVHPAWIDDAVVYGVVPALFGSRGIADVTRRLDELARLGINTLWLSPITPAPPRDFGYAVTDYFGVRRAFGSAADLRALIAAAHDRGMRVVLDFVANHLSDRNGYFADAAAHRRASPYFDFFARDAAGHATHYFDWKNLENLNYDNAEVRRMVIEGFAHWVRDFDVDGFRVDAAWGPRERAPAFWARWASELRRIKPDLLLLAEASARDPYYALHGFDAAYDWTDKLGQWAWGGAFEDWPHAASQLRGAVAASASSGTMVFRFIENNDTGARFVTRYGADRTRLAAALLLTLPGLPALYTGQEVGAEYQPYKADGPIRWDDHYGLRAWYARLIALRHAEAALRSRALRFIDAGASGQILAYVRPGATSQDDVVVLLNFGADPVQIPCERLFVTTGKRQFVDLVNDRNVVLAGANPTVSVAGYGTLILQAR